MYMNTCEEHYVDRCHQNLTGSRETNHWRPVLWDVSARLPVLEVEIKLQTHSILSLPKRSMLPFAFI